MHKLKVTFIFALVILIGIIVYSTLNNQFEKKSNTTKTNQGYIYPKISSNPVKSTATDELISKFYNDIQSQLTKKGYQSQIASENYSLNDIRMVVMPETQISKKDSDNIKSIIYNVANKDSLEKNALNIKVQLKGNDN